MNLDPETVVIVYPSSAVMFSAHSSTQFFSNVLYHTKLSALKNPILPVHWYTIGQYSPQFDLVSSPQFPPRPPPAFGKRTIQSERS